MMRRLAAVGFLLLLTLGPALAARADDYDAEISAIDNAFDAGIVRIQPGQSIEWSNDGHSPHTVTADDGSFDSGNLAPDATFTTAFDQPGVYSYFCRYHGAPGVGMTGIVVVGDAEIPSPGGGGVGPGREPVPTGVRRDGPGAGGLPDHPGGGRPREAGRDGPDRARRLPRGGRGHDAVHHDPGRRPQPQHHRREGRAPERHPRDRGRRRRDREPDHEAFRPERCPVDERVRLPRVLRDGVQQRRLRHLRVRLRSTGSSTTRTREARPTRASTSGSATRVTR